MNYVTLDSAWKRLKRELRVSDKACRVYDFLTEKFNRAFWPDFMCLSHSEICEAVHICAKTLRRAIRELMSLSFIAYKPGVGHDRTVYHLLNIAAEPPKNKPPAKYPPKQVPDRAESPDSQNANNTPEADRGEAAMNSVGWVKWCLKTVGGFKPLKTQSGAFAHTVSAGILRWCRSTLMCHRNWKTAITPQMLESPWSVEWA